MQPSLLHLARRPGITLSVILALLVPLLIPFQAGAQDGQPDGQLSWDDAPLVPQ
jgi:hypothetical protein